MSCHTEVHGEFKECVIGSNLNMLKFDQECYRDPNEYVSSFDGYFGKVQSSVYSAFVFSKHNSILETKGYECKMVVHNYRFSRDFLFNKYIQKDLHIARLTRSECLQMVRDKTCGNLERKQKMTCTSPNECHFVAEKVESFPFYFGQIEKEFVDCQFHERIVVAQTLETKVFQNAIEPCFAQDEVCYLAESTVVWEREEVRKCTFERLIDLPQLQSMPGSRSTIFYTENNQYLFKVTQKQTQCGFEFFQTTEGLFLAFYTPNSDLKNRLAEIPISKYNINHFVDKDRNDLILAENDYQKMKMTEMTLDVTCSMFMNTIQSNINNDDTFLTLNYLGLYFLLKNFSFTKKLKLLFRFRTKKLGHLYKRWPSFYSNLFERFVSLRFRNNRSERL
jgi:hypothetical protein